MIKPVIKPRIVAIFHQKGGVGKTTTTLNLAATLAGMQQPVLMIDLDPAGNLTSGIGLKISKVRQSIADVLVGSETLESVIQPTGIPFLSIIPSNLELMSAVKLLTLRSRHERLLRKSIDLPQLGPQMRRSPVSLLKWILIDCPPSGLPLIMQALVASDLLLTPLRCEYYALQSLELVFGLIREVRMKFNPSLDFRMLINAFVKRGKLQTMILEQLRNFYGEYMFNTMISNNSKVGYSQVEGKSVLSYAPKAVVTEQYQSLAQELMDFFVSKNNNY